MLNRPAISAAVEGIVDEAVVRRLIVHAGGVMGPVYGKGGKQALRLKINGYNNAAKYAPWLVLVDLDADECAPPMCADWIPRPAPRLCFRVAVREVEAWLLADTSTMARFLGIAARMIPVDPEQLNNPKTTMVQLARRSRHRAIRQDMVPREEAARPIGPAYSSRLIEYAIRHWRPDVAARCADSLKRAIESLKLLVAEGK